MATRNITILVRAQGTAQAARQIGSVTAELHRMGQQSRRTSDLVRNMSHQFQNMGNSMATIGRRVGYTFTAMAAAATYAGIKFNATMESQKVAFASFLGGKKEADAYVKSLVTIATETPFRLTDVVQGTRHLLAFGMQAGEARQTMKLLGNAIATSAGGAEEIERSTRALGQIQAAGVLHAQDLNQLIQANVLTLPQLTARMGTTTKKFRKEMSLGKVTSEEFFAALRESWEKDPMYKGAAEKQMRTFNGQLERTKDLFERATGAMTVPLFELLRKRILPAASDLLTTFEAIFSYKRLTFGEKMAASLRAVEAKWKPLREDFMRWWEKNNVGDKIREQFERFISWAIPKLTQFAQDAAKSLWESFKTFDPKTKGIVALALLTRLGITQTAVAGAAGLLWSWLKFGGTGGGGKGGKGGALTGAAGGVVPVFVTNWGGTTTPGPKGPGGGPVVTGPGGKPKPGGRIPGPLKRLGKLGVWLSAANAGATALSGGSATDVFKALDPTSPLGWLGLPTAGDAFSRIAENPGGAKAGIPSPPLGDLGNMITGGLSSAAGGLGNWLHGASARPRSLWDDFVNWQQNNWSQSGGVRREGQWYPSRQAANAAGAKTGAQLNRESSARWRDQNSIPSMIDQFMAWEAGSGGQGRPSSAMDKMLYGTTVINLQVDGKTIATANYNAAKLKQSMR